MKKTEQSGSESWALSMSNTHLKMTLLLFREESWCVWNVLVHVSSHVRNNQRTSSAIKTS